MNPDITLHQASQEYLNYLQEVGRSPRTLLTYGNDFIQMETFFGQDRKLASILNIHIGKFLKSDELLKLPNDKMRSERTINKTIRVLRMFFVWAKEVGYIDTLPLTKEIAMGRSLKAPSSLSAI